MNELKSEVRDIFGKVSEQAKVIGVLVLLMWVPETIDTLFLGQGLNIYGIIPRDLTGLRGIVLSPFLHSGFTHLIGNTAPFVALAWLILAQGAKRFAIVSIVVTFISGMGVWLFGASNSITIGASGVVFGYFGYLLLHGIFDRRIASILLSLAVGVVYGTLLFGVLPSQPGISWLGHLFGLLGGGLVAWIFGRSPKTSASAA